MNKSLRMKMLTYILLSTVVIFAVILGYLGFTMKKNLMENAKELTSTYSDEYSNEIRVRLSKNLEFARVVAQSFEAFQTIPSENRIEVHNSMMKNLLQKNPDLLAVWVNWELSTLYPSWSKPYGRERLIFHKDGNNFIYQFEQLDTVPGFTRGSYYEAMESKVDLVTNPYWFTFAGTGEQYLETSFGVPIMVDGAFGGLAGVDVELQYFQNIIKEISPFESSFGYMIANDGQIVAHPNEELVGLTLEDFLPGRSEEILLQIQEGKEFEMIIDNNGTDYYTAFSPIVLGNSNTPWSFAMAVPLEVIYSEAKSTFLRTIIVGIIGLVLITIIVSFIAHSIVAPIAKTTKTLGLLAKGDIEDVKKLEVAQQDEIGQMSHSVNTLIDGLNSTAEFALEIGKGNYNKDFSVLSEKDVLGNALLEMRDSLVQAKKQEEERKLEDEKQNWATQGMAKFGEILRQNTDDMNEFAYHIISNLVDYIGANQGGLFIINDEDKGDEFIELLASYAYERRKYIDKRIEMGVGLIGRCIQEKKTIYMTDLPDDYITITSGLGQAKPNALLVVPLMVNEEIFGVVELAGFNEFEPQVIKFVEDIGKTIASTISTTKINIRTSKLLEQSQQQSEEMAAQEEEMRQNMEELQATQEEAARRSAEMQGLLDALNSSNLVIEYDLDGNIISVNDNYLQLVGASRDQMIGTHHTDNMKLTAKQKKEISKFWEDLRKGISKKETNTVEFKGKEYTFVETYTPILDENGNPEKVLKISTDISDFIGKSKK